MLASQHATRLTFADSRGGRFRTKPPLPAQQDSLRLHCTACSASASTTYSSKRHSHQPTALVVGGGWAGFGAALALLKAGAAVTLLDAAPTPGGLSTGWRTPGGRYVEPGIKGFWYQYANIAALVAELGLPDPFTPWTRSSFYSPAGLVVRSPIFQDLPRLPTPFGSFLYTSPYFRDLPVWDRLSAVPLVQALLEHDASDTAYAHYDAMSAAELFRSAGVTDRLYREFLEPMLLVTLFAPPEELSAAAALGALYYFVLAHQANFDVRWCRGPVAERLLAPLVRRLESLGGRLLGGRFVQTVTLTDGDSPVRVVAGRRGEEAQETFEAGALVFAVGVGAMQRIVAASPLLAGRPEFAGVASLATVDVIAVRLWLDRRVQVETPSNVMAGFDAGVGATFFDLTTLQDEYRHKPNSVIEVDFYHAAPLLGLSDAELIQTALQRYLAACVPAFRSCAVLDASVLRFPGAVTAFSPGSARFMPGATTSFGSIFMAGDWAAQGPGTHAAKGLSQEKAYVSGLQAGNLAAVQLGLTPVAKVIDAEPDEPHVAAGKALAALAWQAKR